MVHDRAYHYRMLLKHKNEADPLDTWEGRQPSKLRLTSTSKDAEMAEARKVDFPPFKPVLRPKSPQELRDEALADVLAAALAEAIYPVTHPVPVPASPPVGFVVAPLPLVPAPVSPEPPATPVPDGPPPAPAATS